MGWHPLAVVQYTFTHKQYREEQNDTEYPEWNIYNNKNTLILQSVYILYKIMKKHTEHTSVGTMIQNKQRIEKCDRRNKHKSNKCHMINIASNNDRDAVAKTFTPLKYTCQQFTSARLKLIQIHFTNLSFGFTPV